MPTYTVTVANLSLSQQQKSQIAEAISVEGVWIYLLDIPPTQMIEFGRFFASAGR